MREFKHPNMTNFNCPICGTNKDLPVVLVPIEETREDFIVQAEQVHSDCYKLYCSMHDYECEIEEYSK